MLDLFAKMSHPLSMHMNIPQIIELHIAGDAKLAARSQLLAWSPFWTARTAQMTLRGTTPPSSPSAKPVVVGFCVPLMSVRGVTSFLPSLFLHF